MFYSYDGYNFKKYPKPIIEKSYTIRNYRDPTVFKFKDSHYNLVMVENMQFGIHKSPDLINFKKTSVFKPTNLPKDIVELETPNIIEIKNQSFLIISANRELNNPPTGFPFYCSTRYFVGNFDGYEFKLNKNQSREFSGPDLYAISINDENILMGMINNWKYLMETTFNGTLTYPRRLNKIVLNNYTYLTQEFIQLNAFNKQLVDLKDLIDQDFKFNLTINRPHYIKIKLMNLDSCESDCDFKLKFESANNTISIGYEYSSNEFYLDRSKSIQINSFYNDVHKHKSKYKKLLSDSEFELDLILDVDTIEFLTDKGIVDITALHLNHKVFDKLTLVTNKNYKADIKISYYKASEIRN